MAPNHPMPVLEMLSQVLICGDNELKARVANICQILVKDRCHSLSIRRDTKAQTGMKLGSLCAQPFREA